MTANRLNDYFWVGIVILVIAADRITKILVIHYLPFGQPLEIIPVFSLFFTLNSGAAFSFLEQAGGWQVWMFGCIAIAVSTFLVVWLCRIPQHHNWLKIALALILGGTLGNLYDRIFFQHVVDFLLFHYTTYQFPAFNIADSAITVGATMLIIDIACKGKIK
jgi:signal peptidase II